MVTASKLAPDSPPALDCDLCIVGAGYAALNGLNAAAKYLKKGERVVLVDKNATWGGQWVQQYDFVRLHQPYRMFTAGDQRWTLKRDPSYLATRREVLEHLATVPHVSAGHLEVKPLFGHAYRGHTVSEGRAEIAAAPVSSDDPSATVRIRARRLLKATGTDIVMLPPFRLSSRQVRSVAVSDPVLATPEFLESAAPVYVIGSGKTAMDTVRHVLQQSRAKRPVHVLAGSGMWFVVRDSAFPGGRARHFGGMLVADYFLRLALPFDGRNEAAVVQSLAADGLMTNVFGQGGNFRFGLLSLAERDEVRAGVSEVHRGHLVDVDHGHMVVREGGSERKVPVADGSWFINCSTHLRYFPHEPVLQDGGVVCAPQFMLGFSGTSAYYGAHLWFRGELASVAEELFRVRIDVEPKLRFGPHMGLMVMANLALSRPALSLMTKFEGDFNKWYPLHRQLPMLARVMATRGKVIRKAEELLRTRFSDAPEA